MNCIKLNNTYLVDVRKKFEYVFSLSLSRKFKGGICWPSRMEVIFVLPDFFRSQARQIISLSVSCLSRVNLNRARKLIIAR